MDEQRFDAALRALNTGTTRRRGLAAAFGVLLGGASIAGTEAKARKQGGDRKARMSDPSAEGPCGSTAKANRCKKNSQCCTNYCKNGKCRCADAGIKCTSKTVCCNGNSCYKGVCTKNRDIPKPKPPKPACSAATCANGCCDGATCRTDQCGTGGGVCTVPTPGLQTMDSTGSGDTAVAVAKRSYLSSDRLTLFIASWNNASDPAPNGYVSIWTRTSPIAPFVFEQRLTSNSLQKPEYIAVSDDLSTVATMSLWNDCGVTWKKSGGAWAESGTIGTCGGSDLVDPLALALNANGTTAYVHSAGVSGGIQVWNYVSPAWTYSGTTILSTNGGCAVGGIDPNVNTCPKSIFVNAAEDKLYVCTGNSGSGDHGMQLITKSGSTWTGAWAGPAEAAPYGGQGCWVDTVNEDVFFVSLSSTEVKKSNFANGTSYDVVTLPVTPANNLSAVAVRGYNANDANAATWVFSEAFSGAQVSVGTCP